jgi:hypothetical protein
MIERVRHSKNKPKVAAERITVLDDRLLHMSREEAKAYMDAYLKERALAVDASAKRESNGQWQGRGQSPSVRRRRA